MNIPIVTDVFAMIMKLIMEVISNNFGIAIILFTVITKILLFPLQLKSKKGMIDQQRIAPQLAALEKKYRNNKQKYSEEVQKLYKKEGVSMMGGCLPTLLMLVVILGLYGPIYRPIHYLMVDKNADTVAALSNQLSVDYANGAYLGDTGEDSAIVKVNKQIEAGRVDELTLSQALNGNVERVQALIGAPEGYAGLFEIDFNFFGLNLGIQPSYSPFNIQALLPIISAITAYLMSMLTQKLNAASVNNSAAAQAANTSKMMLYFMPIMSLVIGFTLPAGLTLYWIVNNILSAIQEPILMIIAKKKYGGNMPAVEEKGKKKAKPVIETTGEEVKTVEAVETVEEEAEEETKESDDDSILDNDDE
ncbi:MAG: YidC/Oxa1 family membrane protein insertase [Ruminococcaceae bacterium]|nr:YidC/Oxa1 family membrane protein insertase [Oscillospiraceae bacterium]